MYLPGWGPEPPAGGGVPFRPKYSQMMGHFTDHDDGEALSAVLNR